MYFCIRDDDTSFFTDPAELEDAYGDIKLLGPVSLAIIPFCRAGTSKAVPESSRNRWTVHPLHENAALVAYLREEVGKGRFEAMLHGYHHDEPDGMPEFVGGEQLASKVADGRKYLEDLLGTRISVFVPPHNAIRRRGLRGVEQAGLQLGGVTGVRTGWSLTSLQTWRTWFHLRQWKHGGGIGTPWVMDLSGHREVPGNPITPSSRFADTEAAFEAALSLDGVFCAATHYWEFGARSNHAGDPTVGDQLRLLVDRVCQDDRVRWRSVGAVANGSDGIC